MIRTKVDCTPTKPGMVISTFSSDMCWPWCLENKDAHIHPLEFILIGMFKHLYTHCRNWTFTSIYIRTVLQYYSGITYSNHYNHESFFACKCPLQSASSFTFYNMFIYMGSVQKTLYDPFGLPNTESHEVDSDKPQRKMGVSSSSWGSPRMDGL